MRRIWWLLCDREVRAAVGNLLSVAHKAREGEEARIINQCATIVELAADAWQDGRYDPTERSADMGEMWALYDIVRGKE